MSNEDEDNRIYTVVRNDEEQYSIWAVGRPVPPGWTEIGRSGPKAECLAHIREVWTNLRPASLRRAMDDTRGPIPEPGVAVATRR